MTLYDSRKKTCWTYLLLTLTHSFFSTKWFSRYLLPNLITSAHFEIAVQPHRAYLVFFCRALIDCSRMLLFSWWYGSSDFFLVASDRWYSSSISSYLPCFNVERCQVIQGLIELIIEWWWCPCFHRCWHQNCVERLAGQNENWTSTLIMFNKRAFFILYIFR